MKRLAILTLVAALGFVPVGCQNGRLFRGCRPQPAPECLPCCPTPVCVDDCCAGGSPPMMVAPTSPAPVPVPATTGS